VSLARRAIHATDVWRQSPSTKTPDLCSGWDPKNKLCTLIPFYEIFKTHMFAR